MSEEKKEYKVHRLTIPTEDLEIIKEALTDKFYSLKSNKEALFFTYLKCLNKEEIENMITATIRKEAKTEAVLEYVRSAWREESSNLDY